MNLFIFKNYFFASEKQVIGVVRGNETGMRRYIFFELFFESAVWDLKIVQRSVQKEKRIMEQIKVA